jgi:phage terminase large subunit
VQEAIELHEEDWEALLTRLRNGRLPYQQILADTNPDTPQHWIRKRHTNGQLTLVDSCHEDNPLLFDASRQLWTPKGLEYLETLERLTGPRYQRLRHGKWVQAEGAVYDEFNRATHVVDFGYPPMDWDRYVAIDFGYTNPFVCLWGAVDHDGRLWIYRQLVKTQALVEDLAKIITKEMEEEKRRLKLQIVKDRDRTRKDAGMTEQEVARWFLQSMESVDARVKPRAIICDHDAEDRATLQRHLNMQTTPAHKLISPGIQAVQSRLRVQPDGRPRLLIGRNSLMGRDPKMESGKLPIGLAEEMEGYVWDVGNGRKRGEEPLKLNDHAADACRYLVAYLDVQVKKKVEVW